MTNMHIMVLAGGLSHEREVSLRSGSRIAQALRGAGHEVSVRDADASMLDWVVKNKPDAAVIALHGGRGENGSVQTVLEMVGTPFVGAASGPCRLSWDKATAKELVRRAGFTTPDWVTLSHAAFRDFGAASLVAALGDTLLLPLIVKPLTGGSALGATLVHDIAELPAALVSSFAYGDMVLVERFVHGTEVAVSVIDERDGPKALPAVEIIAPGEIFDYDARYTAGMTTYYTPARLDDSVASALSELAVGAHQVLGLRDVSRTDAIVAADGTVCFLEVNVSPGLTETSMLPMAVAAAGRTVGDVYSSLINAAISRCQ
ncbi:MAG: D-alanine--D-alanine ligase [Nakamurella sp.]